VARWRHRRRSDLEYGRNLLERLVLDGQILDTQPLRVALVKDSGENYRPEDVGAASENLVGTWERSVVSRRWVRKAKTNAGPHLVVLERVEPGKRDPDVGELLGTVLRLVGCRAGRRRHQRACWAQEHSTASLTETGTPERLLEDNHLGQRERCHALADDEDSAQTLVVLNRAGA
jgi:hypothetical protein